MRIALAFAASCLAAPALAQGFNTPEALLADLYDYATAQQDAAAADPDNLTGYDQYLSARLLDLWHTDIENTQTGDAPTIDFDPVADGQDNSISTVVIGTPIVIDDTAEVEVQFDNYDTPTTLYYTLARQDDGWKVDDIANQQGEFPWSLTDLLGGGN